MNTLTKKDETRVHPQTVEREMIEPYYTVRGEEDAYKVSVFLPGAARDTIRVNFEESLLTIRGERVDTLPEGWRLLHRESSDATYELKLRVPAEIDGTRIGARHENGVLYLTLPKAEAAKPRTIEIE